MSNETARYLSNQSLPNPITFSAQSPIGTGTGLYAEDPASVLKQLSQANNDLAAAGNTIAGLEEELKRAYAARDQWRDLANHVMRVFANA